MEQKESMSRRDALKTMGVIVATATLSSTGLSVHACPQKALTLERERNPQARFRNENVSLRDIKEVNHQK